MDFLLGGEERSGKSTNKNPEKIEILKKIYSWKRSFGLF